MVPDATVGYPEFAQQVPARFPDHVACWKPLYSFANHLMQRSEAHHRFAVLSSAASAFNAFNGVVLLSLNGMGAEAMVVCRSLLETAMNTVYLAADASRTDDYVDFAGIVKHRIAKRWEAGQRSDLIAATQPDYESERHRYPDGRLSWHQQRVDQLAEATGFGDVYGDYYKLWSSIAHGDFLAVTARFARSGHFQPAPAWEFVDTALELGAEIAARLSHQINALLDLGQGATVQEVLATLDRIEPRRQAMRRFLIAQTAPGAASPSQPE